MTDEFVIDAELHALIPPLGEDERNQLEINIKVDGCREPLVVWDRSPLEDNVLLDGHNRYEICTRLGLPFKTVGIALPNKEAAADWIDKNQLGRRNLTPDQMSLIRGRRYNRMKKTKAEAGTIGGLSKGQNDTCLPSTAERLAQEHGVSPATIKRDGKLAEFLEQRPKEAAAVIRGEKRLIEVKREIKKEEGQNIRRNLPELKGTYRAIIIDPPWPVQKIEREVRPNQIQPLDYPTMTIEEIKALPVTSLCASSGAHVYLWATQKYLPTAFEIFEHWGIKYQCLLTWVKNVGFTPFSWMYSTEHVLFGRVGTLDLLKNGERLDFIGKVREHSRKPDEFYEKVKLVSPEPRLDMFAREQRNGFATWGYEENKFGV